MEAAICRVPDVFSSMTRVAGVGRFSVVSGEATSGGLDVPVNLIVAFVAIKRLSIAST
jgi:hypothetical protein